MPTNVETLVTCLVNPAQALENALQQLLARSVYTSTGFVLDQIGSLVGLARTGLAIGNDTVYRAYLLAQIVTNKSHGLPEELIGIARTILGVTTGNIIYSGQNNASALLTISGIVVSQAVAAVLQNMIAIAAAGAGIRIMIVFSESTTATTFKFDAGPGFDQGYLAGGVDPMTTGF